MYCLSIAANGLRVCEGLRSPASSGRKQSMSFANTMIWEVRKRVANGVLPRRPMMRNRQGSNVVATVVKRSAFLIIYLLILTKLNTNYDIIKEICFSLAA